MERQFFDLLNATRAANGRGPLGCNENLTSIARDWSAGMSNVGGLNHHPDLGGQVCSAVPSWTACGENIGFGGSVDTINGALINSPEHFANIVGNYNQVGIGVFVGPGPDGPGTIWVTFEFTNS